jgi:hypothetical protein
VSGFVCYCSHGCYLVAHLSHPPAEVQGCVPAAFPGLGGRVWRFANQTSGGQHVEICGRGKGLGTTVHPRDTWDVRPHGQ